MKNNKVYLTICILISTSILFPLLMMTGCCGYTHFNFYNTLSNCSFEYPPWHHVISIDKGGDGSSRASVFIALIQLKSPQDEYIIVDVMKTDSVFQSDDDLLQYDFNFWQINQQKDEFKVVDRSNLTIDGKAGEKLIYTYFRHPEATIKNDQITLPEKSPAISCNAYFENDGFLWEIKVGAIAERSEQAKIDFEHIVKTFKFID